MQIREIKLALGWKILTTEHVVHIFSPSLGYTWGKGYFVQQLRVADDSKDVVLIQRLLVLWSSRPSGKDHQTRLCQFIFWL